MSTTFSSSDLSFHQGTQISFGDFSYQRAAYDVARYDAISTAGFSGHSTSLDFVMPTDGFLVGSFNPVGNSDLAGLSFTVADGASVGGTDSGAWLGLPDLEAGEIGVSLSQTLDALLAAENPGTGSDGLLFTTVPADTFAVWDAPVDVLSTDPFSDPGSATFATASDGTLIEPMTEAPALTPELDLIVRVIEDPAAGTKAINKSTEGATFGVMNADLQIASAAFVPPEPFRLIVDRFVPGIRVPSLTYFDDHEARGIAVSFITGHNPAGGITQGQTGVRRVNSQDDLAGYLRTASFPVPLENPVQNWAMRSNLIVMQEALKLLGIRAVVVLTDNKAWSPSGTYQQVSVYIGSDQKNQQAYLNATSKGLVEKKMRDILDDRGSPLLIALDRSFKHTLEQAGNAFGKFGQGASDTASTIAGAAAGFLAGTLSGFLQNLQFGH